MTETCRGDYDLLKRAGIQRDILTIDWTEVVLLGNEADQDTTQRPYLDAHLPAGEWLGNAIGMRFFNLAGGIDLKIHSLITRRRASDFWHSLMPMAQTLDNAEQYSIVPFERGQIYYLLPGQGEGQGNRRRSFGTLFATKPFGGIVYRDEIYHLHSGKGRGQTTLGSRTWPPLALQWGLARAYDRISILVELDDDEARTDINRTHLLHHAGQQIDVEQFSEAVRESMPDWVKNIEKLLEPTVDDTIRSTHQWLLQQMREFRNQIEAVGEGGDEPGVIDDAQVGASGGTGGGGGGGGPGAGPGPIRDSRGYVRVHPRLRTMQAPEAEWKPNLWFEDHGQLNVAAFFEPGGPTKAPKLWFNEEHPLFFDLVQRMVHKLPSAVPDAFRRRIVTPQAKDVWYRVAGIQVVTTLALVRMNITHDAILSALTGVVLTSALAGARLTRHFAEAMRTARWEFKAQFANIHVLDDAEEATENQASA